MPSLEELLLFQSVPALLWWLGREMGSACHASFMESWDFLSAALQPYSVLMIRVSSRITVRRVCRICMGLQHYMAWDLGPIRDSDAHFLLWTNKPVSHHNWSLKALLLGAGGVPCCMLKMTSQL